MSESSTNPPAEGDPFDVEAFARATIFAIESADDDDHVDQMRLIRLEEIVAARWPRSWLLRRRLAREIRASVATWDDAYIPRGDFYARRLEWASQQSIDLRTRRSARQAERQAEDDAQRGEGFLP